MRRPLLLVLLCIPTLFIFLGSSPITDSDEAYYAEAAREMVESGDWITPHFNYRVRFEKPILFYWLIAGTYTVTGVGEAAARFWAAMSGVGLTLVAYACGRRWKDEETGFVAGLITATSFAAAAMGRMSLPDLPLAFFISVAAWAGFEAFRLQPASARRWLVLAAAASALAMLTKGPVGVGLPVLIVVSAVALEFFFAGTRRPFPLRASDLAIAAVVFVAIAVPWYAAVTSVHGAGYLHRFFVAENLDRFATARYNDPRPIWFYLPILIGGLMPWTLFAVLWLRGPAARSLGDTLRAEADTVRLVLWAVVPLAVFSVSVGKQPRYILPCLVPLALLLAQAIVARLRAAAGGRDVTLTVIGLVTALVLAAVAALLWRAAPLVAAIGAGSTSGWALLIAAGALLVIVASVRADARSLPAAVAVAGAATLVSLHGAVLSSGKADPVAIAAAAITEARTPDADVCACGAFLRNLPFYARTRVVGAGTQEEVDAALSRPNAVYAVVDARKLEDFEARSGRRLRRLVETRYLNTALLRLDDFLRPDPERVLQQVVVISTR